MPNEDPNFDSLVQSIFDALTNDSLGWTWSGLVGALVKKYDVADLEELHSILGIAIGEATR